MEGILIKRVNVSSCKKHSKKMVYPVCHRRMKLPGHPVRTGQARWGRSTELTALSMSKGFPESNIILYFAPCPPTRRALRGTLRSIRGGDRSGFLDFHLLIATDSLPLSDFRTEYLRAANQATVSLPKLTHYLFPPEHIIPPTPLSNVGREEIINGYFFSSIG